MRLFTSNFELCQSVAMVVVTPTKRTRIVQMRDKENMTFNQIGAELGTSESAARRNYHEVKKTGDFYYYKPHSGRP